MKITTILSLTAPLLIAIINPGAEGHTLFTTLYINDKTQGAGTCVRQTNNTYQPTNPVIDYNGPDIACGFAGDKPVALTCPAPQGAKLSFEYRKIANTPGGEGIDENHKGPCAVYAKQVDSAAAPGSGPGWVKIWDEGFDVGAGLWCTEKVRAAGGFLSISVPAAFPNGYYLVRPELVAMHNTTPQVEPQFYTGCAQIEIKGSSEGSLNAETVSIPGYIKAGDPSITYNIWTQNPASEPYTPPGPKPYSASGSGSGSTVSVRDTNTDSSTSTTMGVGDCIFTNANWCGKEVPSYSTQQGCYDSGENCWAQTDACYASAPPSGNANCIVWSTKCDDIKAQCDAGNWNGPPKFELKNNELQAPASLPPPANGDSGVSAGSSSNSAAVVDTGAAAGSGSGSGTGSGAASGAAATIASQNVANGATGVATVPAAFVETGMPTSANAVAPTTLATVVESSSANGRGRFHGAEAVVHTKCTTPGSEATAYAAKNRRRGHKHDDTVGR